MPLTGTRRHFLQGFGTGLMGVTIAGALSGCGRPAAGDEGERPQSLVGPRQPPPTTGGPMGCETLPRSEFERRDENDKILIKANGIPNHRVGVFPNQDCPGAIRPLLKTYRVDRHPKIAPVPVALNGWLFGVAVNGVVFDPTGPFWSRPGEPVWQFEVMSTVARPYLGLDCSSAHVQPSGEYHYHALPYALLSALERARPGQRMILLGIAADGFPIYGPFAPEDPSTLTSPVRRVRSSYRLKDGARPASGPRGEHDGTFVQDYEYVPDSGDLDECNGRIGATPEFPDGIYHYFLTEEFPFVPRLYRGIPDRSFAHGLPGPDAVPPALRGYGR